MTDTNKIFNWDNIFANSKTFKNNKPFPYGFVENVLYSDFYDALYKTFPKEDDTWESSTNISRSSKRKLFGKDTKYKAADISDPTMSDEWNVFHHYLFSNDFITKMAKYTGINLTALDHFIFINNHKGDFNIPHAHHIGIPEEKYAYKLTVLMYFAKGWKKGDIGGTYVSKTDEDESDIIFEPTNLDNSMICFKETPISFHGSRPMTSDIIRRSIQFTML